MYWLYIVVYGWWLVSFPNKEVKMIVGVFVGVNMFSIVSFFFYILTSFFLLRD